MDPQQQLQKQLLERVIDNLTEVVVNLDRLTPLASIPLLLMSFDVGSKMLRDSLEKEETQPD